MQEVDRIFDAFFRNSVGFNYLPNLLTRTGNSFPPYDVVRIDNNQYKVQIALAGYGPEDVEVKEVDGTLVVEHRSRPTEVKEDEDQVGYYQYRGIAKRAFSLSIALGENTYVSGANFDNGLLVVEVEKSVPEPNVRLIPIGTKQYVALEDNSSDGTALNSTIEKEKSA